MSRKHPGSAGWVIVGWRMYDSAGLRVASWSRDSTESSRSVWQSGDTIRAVYRRPKPQPPKPPQRWGIWSVRFGQWALNVDDSDPRSFDSREAAQRQIDAWISGTTFEPRPLPAGAR